MLILLVFFTKILLMMFTFYVKIAVGVNNAVVADVVVDVFTAVFVYVNVHIYLFMLLLVILPLALLLLLLLLLLSLFMFLIFCSTN